MIEANNTNIEKVYLNFLFKGEQNQQGLLLSHFGVFTQDLIIKCCCSMEELLISKGMPKKLIHGTLSIMMEGLQNIVKYGAKDENGEQSAFMLLWENTSEIVPIFGNLTSSEQRSFLESKLHHLKALYSHQIKTIYRDKLRVNYLNSNEDTSLGFLTMQLKSKASIEHVFYPVLSDKWIFVLNTRLKIH